MSVTLIDKIKKHPFFEHRWVKFLLFLVKNYIDDNCTQKAASLTYTTLLSIVPILTLLLVILSSIPQLAGAKEQIQELIFSNLLPSTGFQVAKYFNEFATNSSNLTVIGIGVLLVTTIMTLTTIEAAFNQIWRVEQRETTIVSLLRYWAIITLAPLVLGTAFIVSSTVQSLSFLNQKIGNYSIDWAVWVQIISVLVMTGGFVLMYWFIPRSQVRFKNALIAGVTVGIIFELLKQSFGYIVQNFTSYQAVYGAFAVIPLFLLWIYLSWNIILVGVQISFALTVFDTKELNPRHALFSLMDMLNVVYREHKKGNVVTEIGLRDVLGRKEVPHWFRYISFLKDNGLITSTEKDEYILRRSLDNYTFWDFYKNLPYPLPHSKDLEKLKGQAPWLQSWIDTLAISEQQLQQNFDVPLSEIFDKAPPRQTPDPEEVKKADSKSKAVDNVASLRQDGLSGSQVSDVLNDEKRIKDAKNDDNITAQANNANAAAFDLEAISSGEFDKAKSSFIPKKPVPKGFDSALNTSALNKNGSADPQDNPKRIEDTTGVRGKFAEIEQIVKHNRLVKVVLSRFTKLTQQPKSAKRLISELDKPDQDGLDP